MSAGQTIIIALDRLLILAFPSLYSNARLHQLQVANVLIWIIPAVIFAYFCTLVAPNSFIPNCVIGQIWRTITGQVHLAMDVTFYCFTVSVYAAILGTLFYRIRTGNGKVMGK